MNKEDLDLILNIDATPTNDKVEEEYTDHSEALLKRWLRKAQEAAKNHNTKGKKLKRRHEWIALPATLLPIIYTPIASLLPNSNGIQAATAGVLITTGVLNGIHAFFDFSKKAERHFRYEALYSDLASTILVELSKSRGIRIRADRFVEQVQARIDQYTAAAPLL